MIELRKDYILNRWVVISEGRAKRPKEFKKVEEVAEGKTCYFCPGNENLTPPEIGRVEEKGAWKLRWFANKFPAMKPEGSVKITGTGFFKKMPAFGYHEVIVETPDHNKQLWDLSEKDIQDVFKVYILRIKELSKKKNVKYVLIFKNHGIEGGTSLIHTHTQLATYPLIPPAVKEELEAVKKFRKCPYCQIIEKERKSKRFVFENKNFIAIAPFASRFNYECWVFSKKHYKRLEEFNEEQLMDLAKIMKKILLKLRELNASYNYFLHYSPDKEDLHFHMEITPRMAVWAGFEFDSGVTINSVSPEEAAQFYKG